MVTGTSVLGVKFTGGVIIAADMLGSYGSLARFRNISRLMKVTSVANDIKENFDSWKPYLIIFLFVCRWMTTLSLEHLGTMLTISTWSRSLNRWCKFLISDWGTQPADSVLTSASKCCFAVSVDEELLGDGHSYSPKAIHSWLTRVMYNRRSKMNPLWNTVVIGGFYNGERWGFWVWQENLCFVQHFTLVEYKWIYLLPICNHLFYN